MLLTFIEENYTNENCVMNYFLQCESIIRFLLYYKLKFPRVFMMIGTLVGLFDGLNLPIITKSFVYSHQTVISCRVARFLSNEGSGA